MNTDDKGKFAGITARRPSNIWSRIADYVAKAGKTEVFAAWEGKAGLGIRNVEVGVPTGNAGSRERQRGLMWGKQFGVPSTNIRGAFPSSPKQFFHIFINIAEHLPHLLDLLPELWSEY